MDLPGKFDPDNLEHAWFPMSFCGSSLDLNLNQTTCEACVPAWCFACAGMCKSKQYQNFLRLLFLLLRIGSFPKFLLPPS